MISKNNAVEILNAGLATGADFAEIFIENKISNNVSVDNDAVDVASLNQIYGAGIRLLKGLQSVYGYTNDISKKALLQLANKLALSFKGERVMSVENIKNVHVRNKHIKAKPFHTLNVEDKINYLKVGAKAALSYDPRIVRVRAMFGDNIQNVTIYNSKGYCYKDERERGRLYLTAIASDGKVIETAGEGPGTSAGFEWFLDNIDIKERGVELAKAAIRKLSAKECPSGKMDVVIGNGFGGVIFHEACGHALEATAVAKKLSVFSDALGTQIANKVVTAIDDGTIINGWGSENIDDEGNKTQKNILIKNGICTSFLIDDFNGRRMGMKGNGACRRQSYRFEPTSRMSNTYIANGKSTPEEIISSVKLGLYAAKLGGGSVDPTTGEFNFACDEAYIIRDGKVCEQVKGATLIGFAKEILMNIDMVGSDCERAQGMCGSVSGSIPVDVGQPTIRVRNITVGGNGGSLE